MLGLLIAVIVLGLMGGIIYVVAMYLLGREDADWSRKYNNKYSGLGATLYDMGYDSNEAGKQRAKANLEAHKARREARGE